MRNRFLSITFVLVTVLFVVASCNNKSTAPGEDDSVTDSTGVEAEDTLSHLPDITFDGEDFCILGYQNLQYPNLGNFEFSAGADAQDVVSAAVYDRNSVIEDRYKVKIVYGESDQVSTLIQEAAMLNEDRYDLCSVPQDWGTSLGTNGYLYNLLSLPYVDWNSPWWTQGITDLVIYDQLYFVSGDLMLFDKARANAIIFNNSMLSDLHIEEDPYAYQFEGNWTLDVMLSMAQQAAFDLNGDTVMDPQTDRYGVVYDSFASIYGFAIGSGIRFLDGNTITDDGDFEITLYSNNLLSFVDKMISLTRDREIAYSSEDVNYDWDAPYITFAAGKSLFIVSNIEGLAYVLANSEFDYGVLSLPKLDEEQEHYYNSSRDWSTVFVVPATITGHEKVGVIMEALGAKSSETTLPAYIESTIMYRYSAETQECRDSLRLIFDTIYYDFGMMYDFGGGWSAVRDVVWSGSNTVASAYGKVEFAIESAIEDFFEAYEALRYDSQK